MGISLDDPQFFKKVAATLGDKADQEALAELQASLDTEGDTGRWASAFALNHSNIQPKQVSSMNLSNTKGEQVNE